MNIINMNVRDIIPYANNAKKHDDKQIKNVMESIRQFGFAQPLVVDKNNVLIIGHCRLTASKRLKLTEVPVLKMDNLTEEQVKKLRLLDNKLNESDWDIDLLLEEINGLEFDGFDMDWDLPEEPEEEPAVEEIDIPEDAEQRTKKGDIYQLGEHRLIVGDSTDPETIKRLMNGQKADLILTDPPYNVALGQHNLPSEAKQAHRRTDGLVIENDSWENEEEFTAFLTKAFTVARENMRPGAAFYIWHADMSRRSFLDACEKAGWQIRQVLVWNKNIFVLGRQDYQWKHEPCLYGWEDGAPHYFVPERNISTVLKDIEDMDPRSMKKEELVRIVEKLLEEGNATTVIDEDKPSRSVQHPTMKPLRLLARQVRNSTKRGESVLDQFGGSGSTLMTCEQLKRKCYTCEIDPHYADVILKRWEDYTGEEARLIERI